MSSIMVVARKEIRESLLSIRYWVLIGLVVLLYIVTAYSIGFAIRIGGGAGRVFVGAGATAASTLGIMAPILGIALGFGAISGERERGTIRLVLARPIYRDTLVNGKVIAAIALLAIAVVASTAIGVLASAAIQGANLTPTDAVRYGLLALAALLLALAYYGISLLFSVVLSRSSYALVASIIVWFFFAFILPIIASFIAMATLGPPPVGPIGGRFNQTNPQFEQYWRQYTQISGTVQLLSPNTRYSTFAGAIFQQPRYSSSQLDVASLMAQHWVDLTIILIYFVVPLIAAYAVFTRTHEAKLT